MIRLLVGVSLLSLVLVTASAEPPATTPEAHVCTFSIVALDPEKKEWGVGVASKYLAVGSVVPWAKADVGAIATQSYANTSYGPDGLTMLAKGMSAEDTLKKLIDADGKSASRQVGIVDTNGGSANFTGKDCNPWAGGKKGTNYTCQGNLLAGPEVVDAMAEAFEKTKGPLAWRIMAALEAGESKGGDKRGKQSAAILIVRDKGGAGGYNDRYIDFRVDDHAEPIPELGRILALKVRRPVK